MNAIQRRSLDERFNTATHLAGVVFTLATAGILLKLGYSKNWQNAFGTTFFTCGMLLMYAASTLYHWWMPGHTKRALRILDHISIYVMIAASYTPHLHRCRRRHVGLDSLRYLVGNRGRWSCLQDYGHRPLPTPLTPALSGHGLELHLCGRARVYPTHAGCSCLHRG